MRPTLLPAAGAAIVAVVVTTSAAVPERLASTAATAAPAATPTTAAATHAKRAPCPAFLDRQFQRLHSSQKVNLCEIAAGRPLLIVNTASHCGYTSQFKGLEALHRKYRDRGLVVVGFPSDSFDQESADAAETAEVCYVNYGVTFTMVATSPVTGPDANPTFRELARQSGEPAWNFNKYLVTADGKVARHFGSSVTPESPELAEAIERVVKAST